MNQLFFITLPWGCGATSDDETSDVEANDVEAGDRGTSESKILLILVD